MPTPSADAVMLSPPAEPLSHSLNRSTCPPEEERALESTELADDCGQPEIGGDDTYARPLQQPTPPTDGFDSPDAVAGAQQVSHKKVTEEEDGPARDTPSPMSALEESGDGDQRLSRASPSTSPIATIPYSGLLGSPFPKTRFLPNSTSSFLQPGSKFKGTQQSDRQVYEVQVELKHVDMAESFLCGYLRIQGLTDDHPTLTTYFEGEIIGTKYTFQTRHAEWGSNEKVDMQHWGRFPAWRPLAKQARRPDFSYKNFAQRDNIFMRWKEHFLVPDHKLRAISGASFEGFYYICFNQVSGSVSGIYFHAKSEKYQQLELKHVEDHGCMSAIEFR